MKQTMIASMLAAFVICARAGDFKNPSFELPLGTPENSAGWGDHGETFGDASVVKVGEGSHPKSAKDGVRVAQINAPAGTWNGIWQQLPRDENTTVRFKAHYLIQGGNLPDGVATFMKLEFFDEEGTQISAIEGEPHVNDTDGQWVADALEATTPPGTRSVRFVMIAGENNRGEIANSRIFWDLAYAE